jgi:pyruvate-formate lyase
MARFDEMMDWLAKVYVNAMNVIHYMHDKYAYERIEMALHDYAVGRTMAFGIAGLSVVADSLSAIKHALCVRFATNRGLIVDFETTGEYPERSATTTTASTTSPSTSSRRSWRSFVASRPTGMRRTRSRC